MVDLNEYSVEEQKKIRRRIKQIWYHMRSRCYNHECDTYELYGGRGITICDEWLNDVEVFIEWALANGYNPELDKKDCTIDRIDNDKGYSPDNCRWTSMYQQSRNRRNTLRIEYNGENMSWQDFVDITGITSEKFVRRRVESGMSADEIIKEWEYRTDKEHYMTETEAMEYYHVDKGTITRRLKNGELIGYKMRGGVYIPKGQEIKKRRAKLTNEEKEQIYQFRSEGKKLKEVRELFNVSDCTIQQVMKDKRAELEKKLKEMPKFGISFAK